MNVELLFQIAAVGITVSVLNLLLNKTDKSEYAMLITVAGIIIVTVLVAGEIRTFFDTIQRLFKI